MAGLLHKNGIIMGRDKEFYPPPMKENPSGFYENVRFRRLNDKVLAQVGYKVKSWKPVPTEPIVPDDETMVAMASLIEEYHSEFECFGWKDPRTSLVLDSWLEILSQYGLKDETRIIHMIRNPKQIANSMRRRGNKEKWKGQFAEVAQSYRTLCLKHVDEADFERQQMVLPFRQFMLDTEKTAEMLSEFLGLELTDLSHVNPHLKG
jgi:hypothetical protein